MKRALGLVALLGCLSFAGNAATFTPCDFGKFAGQVMPVPSSNYLHFRIDTTGSTIVTATVPVKSGHITWALETGTANWQQAWGSVNNSAFLAVAPTGTSNTTNWEPNPIARKLDPISGTTVNDFPTLTAVQSASVSSSIGGSYCYQ